MTENKFAAYPLDPSIIRALDVLKYTAPTKVQEKVLPLLLNHQDVVVKSQTGSGKTAAFGIPLCELVEWEERAPQALVLTPTRELATQIKEEIFNIGRYKRIKVEALFGKSSYQSQVKNLKQRTHVVVATPGRLFDHIQRGTIDLSKIKTVIIDEADEMLAMGFIEQVEEILNEIPNKKTMALFSATMPSAIARLAEFFLKNPQEVSIETAPESKKKIQQHFVRVTDDTKLKTAKRRATWYSRNEPRWCSKSCRLCVSMMPNAIRWLTWPIPTKWWKARRKTRSARCRLCRGINSGMNYATTCGLAG